MKKPLVEIKDLKKIYHTPKNETVAVEGFSLRIDEGDFISLVGPSGCGKSTVLSVLAGLTELSDGEISYHEDISVGYMLQHDCLFEWMTILDNVLLGLKIKGALNYDSENYAKDLLKTYGLGDFTSSYPHELSGGMRQRAALIRTLAIKPKLLLLDEPFSALDSQMRITVSEDIGRIIKNQGLTAILITHDLSEAICLSDKIAVLSPRPARVMNVYDIDLPDDLSTAKKRTSAKFGEYYNILSKELYG
ncbi:MAG: ABC transporter ATP-binding protein [Eubacteriaceae bacterium]|nr:ABC transporter ATP-binding protein [Eubacteriaceae bacterium]